MVVVRRTESERKRKGTGWPPKFDLKTKTPTKISDETRDPKNYIELLRNKRTIMFSKQKNDE